MNYTLLDKVNERGDNDFYLTDNSKSMDDTKAGG